MAHSDISAAGQAGPTFGDVVAAIFGQDFDPRTVHVTSFKGDPHNKEDAHWHGSRLLGRMLPDGRTMAPAGDENSFICMGVLDPESKGRSLGAVRAHVAFWMDDVGTKTPTARVTDWIGKTGLAPTLVVETSPANYSYFWALKEAVPEDGSFEAQTVAAIRHKLKVDGWGDPATQEAARYMRSGFGVNGKKKYANADGSPFEVQIAVFNPNKKTELDTFATTIMGPNWQAEVKSGQYKTSAQLAAQTGASNERRATMNDPLVKLAQEIGLDPQPSTRAGVIDCHCPNEAAHTGGDPTGYAIINDGMSYCNHASCQHLTSVDFRDMMIDRYEDQINAGIAVGTIIDNPFGDGLIDAGTGEIINPSGQGFLAARRFEGVSVGTDTQSAKTEAEQLAQRQIEATREREAEREALLDALFERFVYVSAPEMFWDRKNAELIAPSRLDRDEEVLRVFKLVNGDKRASNQLLNAVGRLAHVATIANRPYRADQPPVSDIVVVSGTSGRKRNAINPFVPTEIGFRTGVPQKFLDHLDFLFGSQPEVRRYLLEYMAFRIQHPDVKMSVIPLIGGAPGVGKDAPLLQPFFKLLGVHNVTSITASKLSGDFNDFLLSPTIHMGEFSLAGSDGAKAYDRLKDYTSPNPVPATINPKYGKTFKAEVAPCFIATTNDEGALAHVPVEDRRFFVAWSDAIRAIGGGQGSGPGTDAYYADLVQHYQRVENLEVLHHYLMNLHIAVFDPNKAPPRTAARHETLVASMSGVARFVYDLVVDGALASRKVLAFDEVQERAGGADVSFIRARASDKAVAEGLKAAGCKYIDRLSVSGKRVRMWTGSCVVLNDGGGGRRRCGRRGGTGVSIAPDIGSLRLVAGSMPRAVDKWSRWGLPQ